MTTERFMIYLAIMAGVTYLVRMLPFVLFRRKIENRFIRSFLYYIPYAVLAAMTLPAILESRAGLIPSAAGLIVAVVTAYFELGLLPVALSACSAVFLCEWIMTTFI